MLLHELLISRTENRVRTVNLSELLCTKMCFEAPHRKTKFETPLVVTNSTTITTIDTYNNSNINTNSNNNNNDNINNNNNNDNNNDNNNNNNNNNNNIM